MSLAPHLPCLQQNLPGADNTASIILREFLTFIRIDPAEKKNTGNDMPSQHASAITMQEASSIEKGGDLSGHRRDHDETTDNGANTSIKLV